MTGIPLKCKCGKTWLCMAGSPFVVGKDGEWVCETCSKGKAVCWRHMAIDCACSREGLMITKSENAMKYVKYTCAKCKAEDTGKYFQEEAIAPVINCWQCGSGRGLDVGQMIEGRKGMFAAQPVTA